MRKSSQWKHGEKFKTRSYVGKYNRTVTGERVFELRYKLKSGKQHNISFESHQAAKKAGWKKIA